MGSSRLVRNLWNFTAQRKTRAVGPGPKFPSLGNYGGVSGVCSLFVVS